MSITPAIMQQSQSYPNMHFFQRVGDNIRDTFKMFISPQNVLKLMGVSLPDDYGLAVSIVQSKLAKIPEVKDFGYVRHNKMLHMLAYIEQPNEDAENKIYAIYGELLDLFPNTNVDLKIIELYGRTKEQVSLLNI
jgi:hypothetical protein